MAGELSQKPLWALPRLARRFVNGETDVQNEFDAPAPWRFCRQQILAFMVLNLLGSCVHIPVPEQNKPVPAAATQVAAEPNKPPVAQP